MTALNHKAFFDAARQLFGGTLTQAQVDGLNAALAAGLGVPDIQPLSSVAMTPRAFITGFIKAHEGGLSLHPKDNGNWFDPVRFAKGWRQRRNMGVLVGSKFGVTAYALATYRNIKTVTRGDMESLTFDEAVNIGVYLYYEAPRFNVLPWDRVTASIVDKGWGSGPGTSIELMQRLVGAAVDGRIGDKETVPKYLAWRAARSEEDAARAWAAVRKAFDASIASNEGPNDPDKAFIRGWNNRTDSFLPGTPWWAAFGGTA